MTKAARPWHRFYKTALWRHRREQQLRLCPLCARCERDGKVVAATVANHKIRHRGDWQLFATGELESLCKHHHDQEVQREEIHGYSDALDSDGLPTDPLHPFNRTTQAKPVAS